MSEKIRIKYLSNQIEPLEYIGGKSDWIDLRAAENVDLKAGDFKLIPLGVAMQLPKGYEAHIIPQPSKTSVSIRPTTWEWWTKAIVETMISGISQPLPCAILQSRLATASASSALWNISLSFLLKS